MRVAPTLSGRVNILAPVDVNIVHDHSDNDQYFPTQFWDANCNVLNGAEVTFEARRPFRKSGGGRPVFRDARIEIALDGADPSANWVITQAVDQTDYKAGNPQKRAIVTARSTAPGQAAFRVKVSFITEDYATLPTGDFTTRITGTISAN